MVPVPEIQMEWDEASCGQLVWLYNEAISHFGGQTEAFFASLARRIARLSTASSRGVRCAWPRLISAAARRIWPSRTIS